MTTQGENCGCGCGPGSACGPGGGLPRRDFLKMAGAGLVATSLGRPLGVMAGPFGAADLSANHLVPADKQLSEAWVRSLFERGVKEVFSGKALETIGMPCGGIGTGQLYLCGDGSLGCWMIFNDAASNWVHGTNATYAHRGIAKPVKQGFGVTVRSADGTTSTKLLNKESFGDGITFEGRYPIGTVRYAEGSFPKVTMEAFSPFIPLNAHDSGLPVTVFRITVENDGDAPVDVSTYGWLENKVCLVSGGQFRGERTRREIAGDGWRGALLGARRAPDPDTPPAPPEVFADFEGTTFGDWTADGDAFGNGPVTGALGNQSPVSGFAGERVVNSYHDGDTTMGTLTSPEFTVTRPFISFLIGGGSHPPGASEGETTLNLVIDGKTVAWATGHNTEVLRGHSWDVREHMGKRARLVAKDTCTGGWGHLLLDRVTFADEPEHKVATALEEARDFGTMALVCRQPEADPALRLDNPMLRGHLWEDVTWDVKEDGTAGVLSGVRRIAPGASATFDYVLAWHFPNRPEGNYYATRFPDAEAAAAYVCNVFDRLAGGTRLWVDTYYDTTLPYWFLDRAHSTLSYLATGTCLWWGNGRFWAYEGVTCCDGTCTHVWNYAHGHARLFPELGRIIREMQDFNPREHGGGFHPDTGLVGFRSNDAYAADGQCGTILKAYREHLMSPDNAFLNRCWPRIKKALEYAIEQDGDDDGLIENSQHNTYDINYFGANTFVGSLYLAALRAGENMAVDTGDMAFAARCRAIFEAGRENTMKRLWNGEYFEQDVDLAEHPQHQYKDGCLADQLFGQGWARQVSLGDIYPPDAVRSALEAIWKYNWAPDIAPYNERHPPFRWFISPGQAGLITCTWPKGNHLDEGTLYREEVWTGIEYQVAGHMAWESMVTEAMAICRAVHDRYHPDLFNPYNEVECGDHYARALASWGVYLALAGFEYHGPKGFLAFAPRVNEDDFRFAFTAAEGWGVYERNRRGKNQTDTVRPLWGRMRLRILRFSLPEGTEDARLNVRLNGERMRVLSHVSPIDVTIDLCDDLTLEPGDILEVSSTTRRK